MHVHLVDLIRFIYFVGLPCFTDVIGIVASICLIYSNTSIDVICVIQLTMLTRISFYLKIRNFVALTGFKDFIVIIYTVHGSLRLWTFVNCKITIGTSCCISIAGFIPLKITCADIFHTVHAGRVIILVSCFHITYLSVL